MSQSQEERLLLEQQRRGYRDLRFTDELEWAFSEHRVQRQRRRLPLIALSAALFQLVYAGLDFTLMPLAVSLSLLPLRLLAVAAVLLAYLYCRRPQSPARRSQQVYAAAYGLNGGAVALIIHLCWAQGTAMPYDGLFLLLLFGYVVLGLSFRASSAAAWGYCSLFLALGLLLTKGGSSLAYQCLFLCCANLIGGTGAYLQEHGQRGAWLNLRLRDCTRQRAETDNARKLRLLAAVSHDLRQPLNAMGLHAQHLQERAVEAEARRISAGLATSVEHLGRMLQSLLDYSRLTMPGAMVAQPQALALHPLLNRLAAETRAEAEQQGAELQLECGELWVRSDALLLERLLRNLLCNALRHAQARRVWLHAHPQGEELWLEVGDDGRGLSPAEQELVFEEFRQLGNPGRNAEYGLGLGLAIVRQLAALLEHPLELHSSLGEGTRLRLRLPLVAVGPETLVATPAKVLEGRVLLLEDDLAGREALLGLLQRWGCEVSACASLEEALACQEATDPQLLISDYRLAGAEDGLRAIERLREAAGRMLPALLISADVGPELMDRCAPAHVTLLAKPLMPARLRQTLAIMLPAALTASRAAAPS